MRLPAVSWLLSALLFPAVAALAAPEPAPGAGLIHAELTLTDATTATGFLRWKDEDAFWDDTFSARQRELPWFEHADQEALKREERDREFASRGLLGRLAYAMHNSDEDVHFSRAFVCRYGDLAALRMDPDGDQPVIAVMRDGREGPIGNPSRDIDANLVLYADGAEPRELDWDEVRLIRFGAAPAGAAPYAQRLTGTVTFRGGEFTGAIQWDLSECTSLDMIDSDQEDVPVGRVRKLARSRRGGTEVTLDDGRVVQMSGSNDVGKGHRGVAVLVPGLGRVVVPWDRFLSADVRTVPPTAPGYDAFTAPTPLQGTVTTADGRALRGRLVYDLDEAWKSDLLHGDLDACNYQIPFELVASITPAGPEKIEVVLTDGRRLALSGDQDTGKGHGGLLVFAPGSDKPEYVSWSRTRRVDFER
ncbi:MAG: hypothetical protein IPK64_13160 [bacterium]|nr:hypothetical protein [bacterium]